MKLRFMEQFMSIFGQATFRDNAVDLFVLVQLFEGSSMAYRDSIKELNLKVNNSWNFWATCTCTIRRPTLYEVFLSLPPLDWRPS